MELEHLGPYRIVGKLGRGGMGTVYEAVHGETGEAAAVKLLSAALAEEEGFRSRFIAEIDTLKKLHHPNIVRLFGHSDPNDKLLFYSMELVDGNSLEEELRRGGRFDWREVARIGIETCKALRHAHDRGVIHRDIKPANLLMAKDGRVKLSDFGIARLFGYSHLTSAGNVLGTAEYMAPEQAEGRPVDVRSDLYSLGALMYALLARRPVFRGKSLPEMLHKQRFEQPEPLRQNVPEAPEEFERILQQLLEKEPAKRIPTADVLARRLEAMLSVLSLSPETMDADRSWFVGNATAPGQSLDIAQAESDVLGPGDLPATRELSSPASDRTGGGAKAAPVTPAVPPLPPRDTPAPPSPKTPAPPLPPGRFVTVSEDELGDDLEEEPRPAVSWQIGALAGAILAIGLTAWWFLQPPTADHLYAKITAKTGDGSIGSLRDAEDDIKAFLDAHSNDHRAGQLRKYQTEIELDRMQREFDSPLKRLVHKNNLKPIELAYAEAMNYVRLDPEIGMAKLQAIVDLYGHAENDADSAKQDRGVFLARRRLNQLREEMRKRVTEQLKSLDDRLNAADALVESSDPDRVKAAKAMYRAVIELYDDKPWAAEAVARARKGLK